MAVFTLSVLLALSCIIFQVSAVPQRGITLQERVSQMEEIMLMSDELLIPPILPCTRNFPENSGEQSAAEWVRLVFHDFVTADVAAGTGGLDASIVFESNRAENTGKVFVNATVDAFLTAANPYLSLSDVIALGAVLALSTCSGFDPFVPLRVGRIDATEAGPTGVPEAFTDVNTTLAQFARAGFNQSETIMAVACGHSVGGVHQVNNPDIVSQSVITANNTDGADNFDSTPGVFDHVGVSEYLTGTGKCGGLLVVGSNVTTRSDLRLFSSDNNATIQSLDSPEAFQDKCAYIFERMLNTVPGNVVLSDPVKISPMKFHNINFDISDDGVLRIFANIRMACLVGQICPPWPATLPYTFTTDEGTTPTFSTGENFVLTSHARLFGNYSEFFVFQNLTAGTRAINFGSNLTHELETDIVTLGTPDFTVHNTTNPSTTYSLQAGVLTSLLPENTTNLTTVHYIQVIPPCGEARQSTIIEVERSLPVTGIKGNYTVFSGDVEFDWIVVGFVWQVGIDGRWSEKSDFQSLSVGGLASQTCFE